MQTAAFALVCLMSAGAVALAAEPPRLPVTVTPPAAAVAPKSLPGGAPTMGPATVVPLHEGADKSHAAPDAAARARPENAHHAESPHGRVCFNAAETREKITARRLAELFRALRSGRLQGEALRVRLCRWKNDQFVYEISVLRRDGRLVHVYMNAANGQTVGALDDPDHKPSDPK